MFTIIEHRLCQFRVDYYIWAYIPPILSHPWCFHVHWIELRYDNHWIITTTTGIIRALVAVDIIFLSKRDTTLRPRVCSQLLIIYLNIFRYLRRFLIYIDTRLFWCSTLDIYCIHMVLLRTLYCVWTEIGEMSKLVRFEISDRHYCPTIWSRYCLDVLDKL